jgi:DNA-binding SARP family transcriptional activator
VKRQHDRPPIPPTAAGSEPQDTAADRLAIVDGDGMVLWRSAAMSERLATLGLSCEDGDDCCLALGCPANTVLGEPGCLTRLALAGDGLAPRPWRPRPGAPPAGRISADVVHAPGGTLVVFDLATYVPAARGESDPVADVHVLALGPLSVRINGMTMDGDWLQQRPGQTFRYLLASRSGAARSEAIADALWPNRGPAAVANVRYCIYKVREQLDDRSGSSRSLVLRSAGGYRLDPDRLVIDVDVFAAKVSAGLEAYRAGRTHAAEALLAEAHGLYRGDFLADDPYAEWAFTEREYLRGLAGKALAARARIALAEDRLEVAASCLQRLAQLEPFDSQVHQMLIQVCLRRGRRTEAVRHYSALRMRLARAFGEAPDFDLAHVASNVARSR